MKQDTKYDTYTYTIPTCLLSALFNGDVSGISDKDEKALNNFLDKVESEFTGQSYRWELQNSQSPHFTHNSDVFGSLGCDCIEIELNVFHTKQE